jgi:hypothetical protein
MRIGSVTRIAQHPRRRIAPLQRLGGNATLAAQSLVRSSRRFQPRANMWAALARTPSTRMLPLD